MSHITCRLTAKNRYQLRNSTIGNRVWATFTFFALIKACSVLNFSGSAVRSCVVFTGLFVCVASGVSLTGVTHGLSSMALTVVAIVSLLHFSIYVQSC